MAQGSKFWKILLTPIQDYFNTMFSEVVPRLVGVLC